MALEFSSYASNPFAKKENPGEAKIAKMKEEQEARRAELNETASIYEAKYKEQLKAYNKATSVFIMEQAKFNSVDKTDAKYEQKEKEFKLAKKEFTTRRNKKDLQLDLFLFHANNANKASRINILDLA